MGEVILSKLSPSKSLGIAALPGLSLWWKAFIPSQTAAQDSHLHLQSFQGFWTMHKDKEELKVYTGEEDTSRDFLFTMGSPTAVEMRLVSMFSQQARVTAISLHKIF